MIEITPDNLHWLGDEAEDQCVHGGLTIVLDGQILMSPSDGGYWNLSATGIYLLRTLEADHSSACSVTERRWFVACCAHDVFPHEDTKYGFVMTDGCGNGTDIKIRHSSDSGEVVVELDGVVTTTAFKDWEKLVALFTSEISDFYSSSLPKTPNTDPAIRKGWEMYWKEWAVRRSRLQPNK